MGGVMASLCEAEEKEARATPARRREASQNRETGDRLSRKSRARAPASVNAH
jgi:hypothetical protein